MLQLLSVKDYVPKIPTFAQIVQSKYVYSSTDISNTQLIALDQLKMGIIARGCVMPGFCTLLSNLLTTYSPSESIPSWSKIWVSEYRRCQKILMIILRALVFNIFFFVDHGTTHEIYSFRIPNVMQGMAFSEAVRYIYQQFQATLVAIECQLTLRGTMTPIINPGSSYTLLGGEIAYLIAVNRKYGVRLSKLTSIPASFSHPIVESPPPAPNSRTSKRVEIPKEVEVTMSNDLHIHPLIDDGVIWDSNENGSLKSFSEVISFNEELSAWEEIFAHLMEKPTPLPVVRLISEDDVKLSGHIIVAGNINIPTLVDFVAPLRMQFESELSPIVLISTEDISDGIWNLVGRFSGVYFIKVVIKFFLIQFHRVS
jgi:hypothetical protein